jgi:hypothetical protein
MTMDPRDQYRVLVRHFCRRIVESDMVSDDGEVTLSLTNLLALLAVPGILYVFVPRVMFKYSLLRYYLGDAPSTLYLPAALGDQFVLLTLSLVVCGAVTVLRWETLFPDLTDHMTVAPLPVRAGVVFAAKITALAVFLAVLVAAVTAGHLALFPGVASAGPAGFTWLLRAYVAHGIATMGAAAYVILLLVAVHGLLLALLGAKPLRRVMPYAQFVLLVWMASVLLLSGRLEFVAGSPRVAWLHPPFWFLGLYQSLLGPPAVQYPGMAERAVTAFALTALLAAASYAISYQRHLKRALETIEEPVGTPGAAVRMARAIFDRLLLRHPIERGAFHFVRQTILRCRAQRLYIFAYVGSGCAFVLNGLVSLYLRDDWAPAPLPEAPVLSIPLVLSFFLLSGLRVVFAIPAELRANWVFRLTESEDSPRLLTGVRKAVLALAVLPIFLLCSPLYITLWGWSAAAMHTIYGVLLSALLIEALLHRFPKMPFTCSYQPGGANLPAMLILFFLVFGIYAYAMASLEAWMFREPRRLVMGIAAMLALWAAWTMWRQRQSHEERALLFDDRPEPLVRTLGLT